MDLFVFIIMRFSLRFFKFDIILIVSENNEKALLLNLSSTKVGVIAQIALPKSFHCCFRSSFSSKNWKRFYCQKYMSIF